MLARSLLALKGCDNRAYSAGRQSLCTICNSRCLPAAKATPLVCAWCLAGSAAVALCCLERVSAESQDPTCFSSPASLWDRAHAHACSHTRSAHLVGSTEMRPVRTSHTLGVPSPLLGRPSVLHWQHRQADQDQHDMSMCPPRACERSASQTCALCACPTPWRYGRPMRWQTRQRALGSCVLQHA